MNFCLKSFQGYLYFTHELIFKKLIKLFQSVVNYFNETLPSRNGREKALYIANAKLKLKKPKKSK